MGRKLLELRIISRMKVSVRNQKHFIAPGCIRQFVDIREQLLCARHVELAAGQHEVRLHVHFPENEITRLHSTVRRLAACNTFLGDDKTQRTVAPAPFVCILELAACNPVQHFRIEQNRRVLMQTKIFLATNFLALIVFSSPSLWAADSITALDVKEGLWEMTVTHSMSGMPATPNIPPDVLAKMPPEQRARVEAAMKGGPSTDVRKECITKEKLEKHSAFSNNRGDCTRTVVNSTGSKLEVKIHCEEKQASTDGTLVLET